MFKAEATWLAERILEYRGSELSPMIHLGSSDRGFRTEIQPWIDETLIRPLAQRGVQVINCDLKEGDDVDIVGDILEDSVVARVRSHRPLALLCANILEHVTEPALFARRCLDLLPPSGLLFITVPRSYPRHADPIDTMFRPTPEEVWELFPGTEMIVGNTIDVGSYRDDLRRRPLIAFRFLRLLFPFLSISRWRNTAAKIYWLFRPYRVTCLVLRKVAA